MKAEKIIPEKIIGIKLQQRIDTFTEKDSIIYALGIGFSRDPLKKQDLKYTYEMNENFQTFPTYYGSLSYLDLLTPLAQSNDFPFFNPMMILHAEQRIQMIKPLTPDTVYVQNGNVIDIADKGKITLITYGINTYTKNSKGQLQLIAISTPSLVIKGIPAFGFKGKNVSEPIPPKPKRNSDIVLEDSSYPSQAFLFRLSRDPNPLHVDPEMAALQNFQRPIIHGLASYGIVARVLVEKFLGGNANRLKIYHTRFMGHVFPGQSYKIQVWKENAYLWFSVTVKQRGATCLYGYLVFHPESKL